MRRMNTALSNSRYPHPAGSSHLYNKECAYYIVFNILGTGALLFQLKSM